MGYPQITALCLRLGFSGISPESLTVVRSITPYLSDEVREEYDRLIADMKAMFAPKEED